MKSRSAAPISRRRRRFVSMIHVVASGIAQQKLCIQLSHEQLPCQRELARETRSEAKGTDPRQCECVREKMHDSRPEVDRASQYGGAVADSGRVGDEHQRRNLDELWTRDELLPGRPALDANCAQAPASVTLSHLRCSRA